MQSQMALSNDALRSYAPSIFAVEPYSKMSERYTFIPTITIVEKMRAEGFMPFSATQAVARSEGKKNFTKHMIRFRQEGVQASALGIVPEIILVNSHDGASTYNLNAGAFRFVCINGLMVGDSYAEMKVRHSGDDGAGVIDATFEVVEEFPKMIDAVEQFSQVRLSAPEQDLFAKAALNLRYDEGTAPITPAQVLRIRRTEDADPTLWNVLNRAQEALTNGGDRGRTVSTHRRLRTRPVKGISENTKLQKSLWTLTEGMAALKA